MRSISSFPYHWLATVHRGALATIIARGNAYKPTVDTTGNSAIRSIDLASAHLPGLSVALVCKECAAIHKAAQKPLLEPRLHYPRPGHQ